jgi:hypothetical protein
VKPDAPRAPTALSTVPNSARVFDAEGAEIGGILIGLIDGYLSFLEIFNYLGWPASSNRGSRPDGQRRRSPPVRADASQFVDWCSVSLYGF